MVKIYIFRNSWFEVGPQPTAHRMGGPTARQPSRIGRYGEYGDQRLQETTQRPA